MKREELLIIFLIMSIPTLALCETTHSIDEPEIVREDLPTDSQEVRKMIICKSQKGHIEVQIPMVGERISNRSRDIDTRLGTEQEQFAPDSVLRIRDQRIQGGYGEEFLTLQSSPREMILPLGPGQATAQIARYHIRLDGNSSEGYQATLYGMKKFGPNVGIYESSFHLNLLCE